LDNRFTFQLVQQSYHVPPGLDSTKIKPASKFCPRTPTALFYVPPAKPRIASSETEPIATSVDDLVDAAPDVSDGSPVVAGSSLGTAADATPRADTVAATQAPSTSVVAHNFVLFPEEDDLKRACDVWRLRTKCAENCSPQAYLSMEDGEQVHTSLTDAEIVVMVNREFKKKLESEQKGSKAAAALTAAKPVPQVTCNEALAALQTLKDYVTQKQTTMLFRQAFERVESAVEHMTYSDIEHHVLNPLFPLTGPAQTKKP
jgi:hypothetical protein